jgi:trigger factor
MDIVENINKENWKVDFEVKLSSEEMKTEEKEKIDEIKKNMNIPGFRKGKVPINYIKTKFSKEINADVDDNIKRKYIQKVFVEKKDKDIVPININNALESSEIEIDENSKTATLKFNAVIYPIIDIKKDAYSNLEVEIKKFEVTEKDIQDKLLQKAENFIDYKEHEIVIDGKDNIFLNIDIYFKDKDGQLLDVLTRNNLSVNIASNDYPDLKEKVIGMKPDEEKSMKIKIPEDPAVGFEDFVGKELELTFKLLKIKERIIPEIDEELAIKAGYESLSEMKKEIEDNLNKEVKKRIKQEKKEKLSEKIIENCQFNIPEELIEYEFANMMQKYAMIFKGRPIEDILSIYGYKNIDDWKEKSKEPIIKNIKNDLIIDAIIKSEKFELDKEAIDAKLEEESKAEGKSKSEFKRFLITNKYYDVWKKQITEEAMANKLVENTKFIEVE